MSVWNVAGRWQGQADPPLSPAGRDQAEAAASGLDPVDLVITSDLERAHHTGRLLAPGAPHITEPLLREFDVGEWSGRTRRQIEQVWPGDLAAFDAGSLTAPPGGESRAEFDRRVMAAARRIAQLAAATPRTIVVSHGGVLRAMGRLLDQVDRHVGHLCGYEAAVESPSLTLLRSVDLLGGQPDDRPREDRVAL